MDLIRKLIPIQPMPKGSDVLFLKPVKNRKPVDMKKLEVILAVIVIVFMGAGAVYTLYIVNMEPKLSQPEVREKDSDKNCVDVPLSIIDTPYMPPTTSMAWKDYSFEQAVFACMGYCKVKSYDPHKSIPTNNGCMCWSKDCKKSERFSWPVDTFMGGRKPLRLHDDGYYRLRSAAIRGETYKSTSHGY
jgi:hypothetical protein